VIGPLTSKWAEFIAWHQDAYPEAMREHHADQWAVRLDSTPYSVGLFAYPLSNHSLLMGWAIFEKESDDAVYLYDLTVLPEFQHRGHGRCIACAALAQTARDHKKVQYHCRANSYAILSDKTLLRQCGYEIQSEVFIENHYLKEYQDESLSGEHAHEILLNPLQR
jgi:ribosomal protein S18 acetylase RimI-like enzyme